MKNTGRPLSKIGVLLWLSQEHGRTVFIGAERYAEQHRSLDIRIIPLVSRGSAACPYEQARRFDGIISTLSHGEMMYHRKRIGLPIIEAPLLPVDEPDVLSAGINLAASARLAVEHFTSLRLRHMVLLHSQREQEAKILWESFQSAAKAAGGTPAIISPVIQKGACLAELFGTSSPIRLPAGVFCLGDRIARRVTEEARAHGVRCPGDLAVLGFGNDPISCMVGFPKLSSLVVPGEKIGWHAAAMIDRLFAGKKPASIRVSPVRVAARETTDMLVTGDPAVEQAVRFIRHNFQLPIVVTEVAKHVGLTRHALESRFKKTVDFTVHEEIVRCRLEHAKMLLARSTTPIKRIAFETGRMPIQNFSRFIHQHTGVSPQKYRSKHGPAEQPAMRGI